MPREITQPSYFRTGKNAGGSAIGKNLFVDPGAGQDEVVLPAAVTSVGCGVTSEDLPAGGTRSIQVEGVAQVVCSAAIALNALVQSGTDGRAATAAASSAIRGRARSATTAAGQLVEVELWKGRFIAP
jgi:hypothetical protein